MTDDCNPARKLNRKIKERIYKMARVANITSDNEDNNNSCGTITHEKYCHQYMCTSCICNSLNKPLLKYLLIMMKDDLEPIDNI